LLHYFQERENGRNWLIAIRNLPVFKLEGKRLEDPCEHRESGSFNVSPRGWQQRG
jgi:hypothetical protein